jgi:cytoskeletal protein CcmA (bactofilin family)
MAKSATKGLYTMLGPGTVLEGNLTVPHSIHIDGSLRGKLDTTEDLMVGVNGVVEANVTARSAIVAGKITGNLVTEERVELQATSSLNGDLRTRELVIEEGAVFQGNCTMSPGKNVKV